MRLRPAPGKTLLVVLMVAAIAALGALLTGVAVDEVAILTGIGLAVLAVICAVDYFVTRRAWVAADARMTRQLPAAFALGVPRHLHLQLTAGGNRQWQVRLHDHSDPTLNTSGLPLRTTIRPSHVTTNEYLVQPTRRGEARFSRADIAVRSMLGLWDLLDRIGEEQTRRVYPDFAQVARYAWLAGDRRLAGIVAVPRAERAAGFHESGWNRIRELRVERNRARKPEIVQLQLVNPKRERLPVRTARDELQDRVVCHEMLDDYSGRGAGG